MEDAVTMTEETFAPSLNDADFGIKVENVEKSNRKSNNC